LSRQVWIRTRVVAGLRGIYVGDDDPVGHVHGPLDVARVLVANGPPFALNVFTSGWEEVVRRTTPPRRPTAA
jgi:hypothetical protein